MSTTPLQALVNQFVADIEGLVRQSVTQDIAKALGLGAGSAAAAAKAGPKPKVKAAPAKPAAKAAAKPAKANSAKGKTAAKKASPAAKAKPEGTRRRRTPKEIETLATKIYDYVSKNPGKRAEDIKSALKIPTNEWELPVEKLISTGKLTTVGEKRATTYSTKG
ncbi:MAG: hypothetical protein U0271_18285 [Polyangiaceae bacterium]